MVDDGRIAFSPAVELSYLTRDEQAELWNLIGQEDATPSLSQALRMKQLSREAKLTPEVLYAILTEEKPNQKEQVRIKTESLRKYFPRNYSAQQMEREIIKLLRPVTARRAGESDDFRILALYRFLPYNVGRKGRTIYGTKFTAIAAGHF